MGRKVKIVQSNTQYNKMFIDAGWELVDSIEDADLVQFTGGEDVTPELYGEPNTSSYSDFRRDAQDLCAFREALALRKPMAGICRGGQFLNVMAGGKMEQHVEGHATGQTHYAKDWVGGEIVEVTSTHHQLMLPSKKGSVILTGNIVGEADTEAVYYPHTLSLCFQPHPEFREAPSALRKLYFKYIDFCFSP